MLQKDDIGRLGTAAFRSLIAGGCWLGGAVIVSMGEPLVVAGALAVATLVGGGVTWSTLRPTPMRLVVTAALLALARLSAGPSGAAIAFVLFAAGALLRVRLSDAALGLALFAGAVSILGGADHRLLAVFLLLGVLTRAIAHVTALLGRWIWPRLLARERGAEPRLAGES